MASGLAIVATSTGGTPELVGDCGLLVPREDPVAMADAIELLVEDGHRRESLAAAARARSEGFTWSSTWSHLVGTAQDLTTGARE